MRVPPSSLQPWGRSISVIFASSPYAGISAARLDSRLLNAELSASCLRERLWGSSKLVVAGLEKCGR